MDRARRDPSREDHGPQCRDRAFRQEYATPVYAGARALLVSNWPVEPTSARALTTDLFRRQQGGSGVTRAQALQQAMHWLIDQDALADAQREKVVFSYALTQGA